ncbi:MAG: hypothetical protein M3O33_21175 [Cyanobacteriota bacterium]|nr:hypothetical protein [Cyanobacteriota bacterium]
MKRRKFIQYGALGSASFVVNLGLLNPKRSDAFLFALLGGTLLEVAFGALIQGAFALARGAWGRRTQEWYNRRLEAQLAQREFLRQKFTDVTVAEVETPQYNVILAAHHRERLGYNAAFSFPQMMESQPIVSSFAGPASIGMGIAAKYLKENQRMSPQQVQRAILPRHSGGLYTYDDWKTWDEPTSFTTYSSEYSDNGVLIRYEAVDPRPGGYGLIDVSVDVGGRIQIPQIRVKYA